MINNIPNWNYKSRQPSKEFSLRESFRRDRKTELQNFRQSMFRCAARNNVQVCGRWISGRGGRGEGRGREFRVAFGPPTAHRWCVVQLVEIGRLRGRAPFVFAATNLERRCVGGATLPENTGHESAAKVHPITEEGRVSLHCSRTWLPTRERERKREETFLLLLLERERKREIEIRDFSSHDVILCCILPFIRECKFKENWFNSLVWFTSNLSGIGVHEGINFFEMWSEARFDLNSRPTRSISECEVLWGYSGAGREGGSWR